MMRAARLRSTVVAVTVLLSAGLSARGDEKCSTCHPETRVEYQNSIHAREGVGCASCHGGDPASQDADAAHQGQFDDLADRHSIPASCAKCHSDLEMMRPYNLPIDQYAIYMTSPHGLAVAAGDLRGAVCSDCHGAHDIRDPADSQSRVHVRNLPATCGECHADESLMEPYGLDAAVVQAYHDGAHGKAIVAGVPAAPSCSSCHGVHGATPPGVGDIDKVCGSCHVETRRAFLEGPHYPRMADADLPECSSCHSNHGIRSLGLTSLKTICIDCHGEGSDEELLGSEIHRLISDAAIEVSAAEALLEEAQKVPLHIEDHLHRIEEARTYLTEAELLVHSVSIEPVEQVTRRARSIGQQIQLEIRPQLSSRTAQIGLALYWFYVAMTIAILVRTRRRLARSHEK